MIDLRDENQYLMNERSLEYLFFAVFSVIKPHTRIRVEYSVNHGIYLHAPEEIISAEEIDRIEQQMNDWIRQDLPIQPEIWSLKDAIDYFDAHDRKDKVELLCRTKPKNVTVYGCNGYYDDLYGEIVNSTAQISPFSLIVCFPGLVLQFPSPADPTKPCRFINNLKYMYIFNRTYEWCKLLSITNVADFYTAFEYRKMRLYIRINEELMDQMIGLLADDIISSGKHIVMISGPSSSGKTTFAARLGVHLMVRGHRAYRLSLDDYYRNTCDLPMDEKGQVDFECLEALDVPLLHEQLNDLAEGKLVQVPRFNFKTHRREEKRVPLQLEDHDILIAEGIHGLNPALVSGRKAYRVFISALNCLNLDDHTRIHTRDGRLLRRMVRDYNFRGTPHEQTLAMWNSVRSGEDKWIFTYQESADFVFNTSLHYELLVLKKYAYEALKKYDGQNPIVHRLLTVLSLLPDFEDELMDEIPPLSLIREFIGGGTAEK